MKSLKKYCYLVTFVIFSQMGKCQQYNTWYFGSGAGLDFNTPTPTPLTNGLTTNVDNSSTISDQSGSLLFYTNGVTVWDKNHAVMPNGNGLTSHFSAGQCCIIVPVPCNVNRYVIFHLSEYSTPGNLKYTIVDMTLNNGLGDVISTQKNVSLGTGWTEKLCAYYNPSGNFYWVLSQKWQSNQYVAFKVDATTIATQSVTTLIGSVLNCGTYGGTHDAMGQLTISPDGTKILNALTCQDKYELFDFNITTGVLSNSIAIPGNGGNAWGTAFSPDSKKIFTNSLFGQSVFQYDINTYAQAAIIGSKTTLITVTTGGYNFGYMELGPNGKVYIAHPNTGNLSVVNNPNLLGTASNFSLTGQSLGTKNSLWGLSRIAYNIPNGQSGFSLTSTVSPSPCNGNNNGSASVTPSSSNLTLSYTWTPGNFSTASVSNLVPGVYTVTASDGGCNTASTQLTITSTSVTSNFNYSLNPCNGSFTLTNTSTGAATYNWNFGDNSSSTLSQPSHSYTSPGTYTIALIAGTANGCNDTIKKTITIGQIVQANFTAQLNICDSIATLNNSSTGGSTYSWNFGDGTTSTLFNPANHIYTTSGIYNILLVVTGFNGCKDSLIKSVSVVKNAQASFNITNLGCSKNISLLNTSSSAIFNAWQFGDGNGSALSNPQHTYNLNGLYTISLIINAGTTCSATATKTIDIGGGPVADFDFITSPCNNTVEFMNTSSDLISNFWSFGDLSSSTFTSPAHNYLLPGTYQVLLIAGANTPCADTVKKFITVNPSYVIADFDFTNPQLTNTANFNNTSINSDSWSWDFGDGTFSADFNPSHNFDLIGKYYVCLVAKNKIGCTDTLCKSVDVYEDWTFYIPNTFSPNEDGVNEIFYAYGTNITNFKIEVYDRWGELIFSSTSLLNGWDGTYKGVPVTDDIYAWKAGFNDYKGKSHSFTGHIQVLK